MLNGMNSGCDISAWSLAAGCVSVLLNKWKSVTYFPLVFLFFSQLKAVLKVFP